ncbi:hypothetical protein KAJ27_25590 [bacterium]|nr:hypothetical protein [bacterium]
MRLDRTSASLHHLNDVHDDGYVQATPIDRIRMVWDITVNLWNIATGGKINAESRLQRDVASLKKI